MVTFTCENAECASVEIAFNFLGNPETAICGSCKETLAATDHRDDPEQSTDFTGFAVN